MKTAMNCVGGGGSLGRAERKCGEAGRVRAPTATNYLRVVPTSLNNESATAAPQLKDLLVPEAAPS